MGSRTQSKQRDADIKGKCKTEKHRNKQGGNTENRKNTEKTIAVCLFIKRAESVVNVIM